MIDIPEYAITGVYKDPGMCLECKCCGLDSTGNCLGNCINGWHTCDYCHKAVKPGELAAALSEEWQPMAGHQECMEFLDAHPDPEVALARAQRNWERE